MLYYTYTTKASTLRAFLERLKSGELSVPKDITKSYLESLGFMGSHDPTIIRVLESLDFVDNTGEPMQNLRDFVEGKSRIIMAKAMRKTYPDLFREFSNPAKKTIDELEDFFAKTKTSVTRRTLRFYVNTFRTLCEFADF